MTDEQLKRVEEIRALLAYAVTQDWTLEQNFNETPRLVLTEVPFLLDLLREQQAEVERETAVRKTAESEAHNHAIRTAELYIERERQQSELEALRKAVNLTLGFMDCCDWNDEDSERDAARVVSACREAARSASEPQAVALFSPAMLPDAPPLIRLGIVHQEPPDATDLLWASQQVAASEPQALPPPEMLCTLCEGPAERDGDEWRHAGSTDMHEDKYFVQTFCPKYGYPIKVKAASEPQA